MLSIKTSDLVSQKSGITYVFSYNLGKTKGDSYYSLPAEKILNLHNLIILINSVINKEQNHFYYNMFLEKIVYQLTKT